MRIPRDALARLPTQLSGGERQRVALMRALMLDPHRTAAGRAAGSAGRHYPARAAKRAEGIFARLAKTVVLVTHDLHEAAWFGDEIVLMRAGHIVQRGRLEDLLSRPGCTLCHRVRPCSAGRSQSRGCMRTILLGVCLVYACGGALAQETLVVGSKRFTESYILGEIAAQSARALLEQQTEHRQGLGNTGILFAALKSGSIDLYPDYTGTVARELLKVRGLGSRVAQPWARVPSAWGSRCRSASRIPMHLPCWTVRRSGLAFKPSAISLRTRSLRFGLSHEFLNRNDGWPGLVRTYGLPQAPRGLDHGLAYEALAGRQIDVMDIYSTDAKIAKYKLRVLRDDRHFFPDYGAMLVYRLDLPQRSPQAWAALQKLQGRIERGSMVAMNAQAELEGKSFGEIADRVSRQQRLGANRQREQGRFCRCCSATTSGGSRGST